MRPSKKTEILDAAVALIERENLEAVSYEALAEASGMSKSGIVYHFPSRHEILRGIHQHLADQWEEELERAAGGPAHSVDAKTRLRAVVLSQSNSATKAELLLEIDARSNSEFSAIWAEVNDRWVPSTTGIEDDDELRSQYLVKVLADGLWMHDYVHEQALTRAQRKALTDHILQMLN
ncbi:TetR/AcrR family transcriptional regulator [Enteractinococcus helveticum]|uniref:TetR family transcriptional regulator n=1 Tax=Enteractinococcus helveticum TaxID=1837282 RepID=A0A1B7LUT7_9MICC|nr:TetR family transcriptional regulator [Enteractinococcus helveticum]OAV51175.1 TetR family transcriptional regulator [Enteractinococcus helveticum]